MPTRSSSELPVRGRPVLTDRAVADMRRHIADCALRLFHEHGFEAVSMRRLASEAGCTPMTIYRYFDRKIDILRFLWADVFGELFDGLDKIAAGEVNAEKRVMALSLGYVEFWLQNRDHYFLVFMSSGVSQTDVSIFVGDEPVVQRFGILRQGLSDAMDRHGVQTDVELKAQLLQCSLNGIVQGLITISAYPWAKPDQLVREAVDAVLGGRAG